MNTYPTIKTLELTAQDEKDIQSVYDRLYLMRSLDQKTEQEQRTIAEETLKKYAPLADRLGIAKVQNELEELGIRYSYPQDYALLKRQLQEAEASCAMVFKTFKLPICSLLDDLGIIYNFSYRMKSVYSIWRKIKTKHVTFDEVYDLFATRIVFKPGGTIPPLQPDLKTLPLEFLNTEKLECWRIYTVITSLYRIHPERVRDWITHPKPSGYEALQVTAMGPDCNWIEIQIRSERMDKLAENGMAAHWKYKQETQI